MRVASFNLLSGRTPADGVVDSDRLLAATRGLDADILALQEVDREQQRSGLADQAALIADGADHRFVATLTGLPGDEWVATTERLPDGPSYGIALVSRLPVRRWHVLRLAPTPFLAPLPGPRGLAWVKDEPRAAVAAELDGVTVACTHLSFLAGWNVVQLRRVRSWLLTLPAPQLLLGDLNMTRSVARVATGWTPLVRGPTYPVWRPHFQLDHVLAARPINYRQPLIHRLGVSDHCAVSVDVL